MIIERIYSAPVDQANLLAAIANKRCTQADVAACYADAITADHEAGKRRMPGVDWTTVHAAIVSRWPRGLEKVKNKAWKLIEETLRGKMVTGKVVTR